MATPTTVARIYQSETYICSSLRFMIVAMILIENITHKITTPMSSGHSSSEYSLLWVMPARSESAASTMATLKKYSVTCASPGNASRVLPKRCTKKKNKAKAEGTVKP